MAERRSGGIYFRSDDRWLSPRSERYAVVLLPESSARKKESPVSVMAISMAWGRRVRRIEQRVGDGKVVEVEDERHDLDRVGAEQFVSEAEAPVQHGTRDRLLKMEGDKPAPALPFLDQAQGETRRGGDELPGKASVHGSGRPIGHAPDVVVCCGLLP